VQQHVSSVGKVGERLDLLQGVERAELGGLGDRDNSGLHVVLVTRAHGGSLDQFEGEFAIRVGTAGQRHWRRFR
jgi:hypothetical protein